jgi:hypothetical protein
MEKNMEMEYGHHLMVIVMLDSGLKEKFKDKEYIHPLMVNSMKESLRIFLSLDGGRNICLMVILIKVIL